MADKRMSIEDVIGQIKPGDTVAIGGGGMQRKPMAIVRAIARSNLKDLHIVSFLGGPDVDLLVGAGKVRAVTFSYVGFDSAGLAPNFRRARQEADLDFFEGSEYIIISGLEAAAKRLPFFPTRSGLGSDILEVNPNCKVFDAPFTGEKLVAVKAIEPDVALIHVNYADPSGYGQILGDVFIDNIITKASKKTFMTTEKLVSTDFIEKNFRTINILRLWVTGVVETPYGAHFTSCFPNYLQDMMHVGVYLKAAKSKESFREYLDKYITDYDNLNYIARIGDIENIKVTSP